MAASMRRAIFFTRTNFLKYLCNNQASVSAICRNKQCFVADSSLNLERNYSVGSEAILQLSQTPNVRYQSSSQGTQLVCWSCNHVNSPNVHICEKCQALQELRGDMTNFEVMDIPTSFVVDTASLTTKYRQLQSRLHPDKFTTKSAKEKELSEQLSSAVNKAYNTLLKPIPRGHYLLKLHGASLEEGEIDMDPEFLMEMMETNEVVFGAQSVDAIQDINQKNKQTIDELIKKVGSHFDNNDIAKAKATLAKLNYYTNIDDKIKSMERQEMDYPAGS